MKVLGLLAFLMVSGFAGAAEKSGRASIIEINSCPAPIVEIPVQNISPRYWTKANAALVVTDAVAKSVDMMFTIRNSAGAGFQENDPLARPFVTHGRAIAGAAQGLLFAGEVFSSYELNKHGHRNLAKVLLLLGIGGNTAGIATTVR